MSERNRRSFLRGMGVAGGVVAGGAGGYVLHSPGSDPAAEANAAAVQGRLPAVPFHGAHQASILTAPARQTTVVSLDATASSRSELVDLFRTVTERARFLTAGGTPAPVGIGGPPSDSGLLGPTVVPDGLTVTFGVGSTLFDDRYGLAAAQPAGLTAMRTFPNDDLDPAQCGGDLIMQLSAGNSDTVVHALRDIARHTRGGMQINWRIDGFASPARPAGTVPRNLMGFMDGIANPPATETDDLLWVRSPSWAAGGSYLVVRLIRMLVEFWDRVDVTEQEQIVGRRRDTGYPLDANSIDATPDYASDPTGDVIPLNSHIRLANPRTPQTASSRILRRGWNYDRGIDQVGDLDMGLIFICFQRSIQRQFEVVQTRLIDEPLVDYISPFGGGYFLALPGVRDSSDWYGRSLLTSRLALLLATRSLAVHITVPWCQPSVRLYLTFHTLNIRRVSMRKRLRPSVAVGAAIVLGAGAAIGATAASASTSGTPAFAGYHTPATVSAVMYRGTNNTATPIKHLVVLFDENISFDHYFGTYPYATNTDGTTFTAKKGTPTVNGLYSKITSKGVTGPLLTSNPNEYNPERLTPAEALTCDQNHGYTPEQEAVDGGKMDKFVQYTESDDCDTTGEFYGPPGIVMDYYDGNTVTGLWNYAQNYAMSDNNYDTTFGPSTEGAVAVTSGLSTDAYAVTPSGTKTTSSAITSYGTIYSDIDPYYDACSDANHTSTNPEGVMTGENIGNLLNAKHVTWGWFQAGFAPTSTNSGGAVCAAQSENIHGDELRSYTPHWNPFEYNASTANPEHLAPTSEAAIGRTDRANHQYDLSDFAETLHDGNLPSVSFLKPSTAQSGHEGESDPLDEQKFIVNTVNEIERSKYWSSTAIVITYDDSDGFYDHVIPKIVNGSSDSTLDTAFCEKAAKTVGSANARCGFGQRLPMVVISPYTRSNYVSHNVTDTTSVVKFIEDNWLHGERIPGSYDSISGSLDAPGGLLDFNVRPNYSRLILNPNTGAVVSCTRR